MNHGTRAGKGCNKGSKCEDFHPKMCPLSISRGECLDESCTLCHVKGTRRKRSTDPKNAVKDDRKEAEPQTSKDKIASSGQLKQQNSSTSTNHTESFLDHINLLKKELQEAMDKKIEMLMSMQSLQNFQPNSQMPSIKIQSPQYFQPNTQMPFVPTPPTTAYAPIPWMPQMYQFQRNPLIPMGY